MASPEIPQTANPLVSASSIISNLAPIFLGSGKTTENSSITKTSSPAALAFNQQLGDEAEENATNPSMTNAVVQNIMNQAAIAFAPTAVQQNSSGMYNTSTLQMLSAQAQGQGVAQSSAAVLNFQTQQQQLAQASATAGLNSTSTQTSADSKQTAPAINVASSPIATALSYGTGALSIAKFLFPDQTKSITDAITAPLKNGVKSLFGGGSNTAAGGAGAGDAVDTSVPTGGAPSGVDGSSFMTADAGNVATDANVGPAIESGGDSLTSAGGAVSDSFDQGASTLASFGDDTGGTVADLGSNLGKDLTDAGGDVSEAAAGGIDAASSAGDVADSFASAGDVANFSSGIASDAAGGIADEGANVGGEIAGDAASAAFSTASGIAAVGGLIHLAGSEIGGDLGTGVQAVGDLLSPANGIADVGAAIGDAIGGTAGQVVDVLTDPIGAISDAVSVVCTVMKEQGTIPEGQWKRSSAIFRNYNHASQKSYWLWARPSAKFIKAHPQYLVSKALQSLFKARTSHVIGHKTAYGLFARSLIFIITVTVGVVSGVAPVEWFKLYLGKVIRKAA